MCACVCTQVHFQECRQLLSGGFPLSPPPGSYPGAGSPRPLALASIAAEADPLSLVHAKAFLSSEPQRHSPRARESAPSVSVMSSESAGPSAVSGH